MIIKTVLFLTVISIIGKYEGVHSSSSVKSYLEFTVNDFESVNAKCHLAMYNVIKNEAHKILENNIDNDITQKERKNIMYKSLFRLLRTYNDGYESHLKEIFPKIWVFYKCLVDAINDNKTDSMKKVLNSVDTLISNDIWTTGTEPYEEDYNHCNDMLILLSKPTEEYIEKDLSKLFYDQGVVYEQNMTTEDESIILPISIKYGFILLLLKEDEIVEFMSSTNEDDKKIFVIDMMKEGLINIFYTIKRELMKLGSLEKVEEYPTIEKWKIIKSISMKIIDATQAVYRIGEDRTHYSGLLRIKQDSKGIISSEQSYPDLIHEYSTFMTIVKSINTKLAMNLQSELNITYVFGQKVVDYIIKENSEELGYHKNTTDPFPGRLTIDDSIRVPILKHTIPPEKANEPFLQNFLNSHKDIQFLLELHGWILTIIEYADLMTKNIPHKLIRISSYIEMGQRRQFKKDKILFQKFLEDFIPIPISDANANE